MPIQQLRLYDILVDIFPGVVFISLMYPLIPGKPLNSPSNPLFSGPLLAVIIVAIGYVTGRVLHYISGRGNEILNKRTGFLVALLALELNLFLMMGHFLAIIYEGTSLINIFTTDVESTYEPGILMLSGMLATLVFLTYLLILTMKDFWYWLKKGKEEPRRVIASNLLRFLPAEHPEEYIDIWLKRGNVTISDPFDSVAGPLESSLATKLREDLQNQYDVDFSQTGLPDTKQDFEWMRYIGYSRLFASQNLYQRYNTLTTFSRNMSFAIWLPYFSYSTVNIYSMTVAKSSLSTGWLSTNPEVRYLITTTLLFIAVLFSLQLSKYSKSRNRQFILDYIESVREDSQS